MGSRFRRILAIPDEPGTTSPALDWMRALAPLAAPFLIVVCAPRVEMALAAASWTVLIIPGMLAVNLLFPPTHPFGHPVSRLGVASVMALLPFGVLAWAGCMLHWTLSTVLGIYAVVYLACIVGLVHFLLRQPASRTDKEPTDPAFNPPLNTPRWIGVVVIIAIVVVMVGVCMASPPTDGTRYDPAKRPGWWHGVAIGAVGSITAALAIVMGYVSGGTSSRPVPASASGAARPAPRRARKRPRKDRGKNADRTRVKARSRDWVSWTALLFWLAAAGLTFHIMRVTYTASIPEKNVPPWNVDDVAYVSEAVDYRYGHAMGLHEPSLGSDHGLRRAGMSPVVAPLVATIARATDIPCAALQHAVLPPLMVLVGMSCLSAALMVILRMHRWAVPLGVLIVAMLIFKTWDYARCVVEMLAFRAMQTKSVHLWLIHPLQLGTLILLARRANLCHLGMAVLVAIVGHGIHPFATVTGMVWSTVMVLAVLAGQRNALLKMVIVLGVYCGLGGVYHYASHRPLAKEPPRSGRESGSRIQSRDLVRVDSFRAAVALEHAAELDRGELSTAFRGALTEEGIRLPRRPAVTRSEEDNTWVIGSPRYGLRVARQDDQLAVYEIAGEPAMRHDPFWALGMNTLFHGGALVVPIVLAFGWRRREILYVGLLGAAALVTCGVEPLGRLLNIVLPTAIMWRARWLLPALVNFAIVGLVLYWAVSVLIRRRDHTTTPWRRLAACLVAAGAFATMLYNTNSPALKLGPPPRQLDKFSGSVHGLVKLLGGVEADPYVWGSWFVHHELPQLMPNVKLVFSREKIMRAAADPRYRRIVTGVFEAFKEGTVTAGQFRALRSLYPIDHVVIDYRYRRREGPVRMLTDLGWQRIGRSGQCEVWQAPDFAAGESSAASPTSP